MQPASVAATLLAMHGLIAKLLPLLLFAGLACGAGQRADASATSSTHRLRSFRRKRAAKHSVYFLGFAGYGEERVFAEEIKLAAKSVGEKYGSTQHSVLLLNDRRDLTTYPLASESSLRYALNALSRVMNRDEDVLFLALSSHGSRGATIEVSNEGMEPRTLGAVTLADLLAESGIRWKVIVVSACFSGAFVEPLADDHTIVITAASKYRTSFGCSDQRDLTYFGEAFYRDSLPGSTQLRAAFEAANARKFAAVKRKRACRPSQPQGYFGPLMEEKLRAVEQAQRSQ